MEHTIPPRALAAPVHLHENEDEYSFVLSGRVGFQIGDEVAEAGPGELVAKPRGVPHAFWNPGDEEARLLELISPPEFASYFEELVPVLMGDGPPDLETLARDPGALLAADGPRHDRPADGRSHGLEPVAR